MAIVSLTLLSACGVTSSETQKVADSHGFERPDNCFLTETLVFAEYPYPNEINGLWGTGGESGLASEEAVSRDSKMVDSYPIYVCYLIYANENTYSTDSYFGLTKIKDMDVTSDEETGIEVTVAKTYGNISVDFDMTKSPEERLTIKSDSDIIDGAIIFKLDSKDNYPSTLYLDIVFEGKHSDYIDKKIDSQEEIIIGSSGSASSNTIETSDISIGYISDTDYENGSYEPSDIKATPVFNGGKCYMKLDFKIKAVTGGGTVKVFTYVHDRGMISATIEEAPTGNIEEITSNNSSKIYASYTAPGTPGESKSVSMIIKLEAISGGDCGIDIFMIGDTKSIINGATHTPINVNTGTPLLKYELSADKRSYTVTELLDKNATKVTIPETLNDGLPVVAINPDIFKNNRNITHFSTGDTVTQIAEGMFENCTALQSVVIGRSVKSIGYGAFKGCSSLNLISFNAESCADLTHNASVFNGAGASRIVIGKSVAKVPAYLFYKSSTAHELYFEEGGICESIGSYAFSGCPNLTYAHINAKRIGKNAFSDCTALQTLTIGENVSVFEDNVFSRCAQISEIYYNARSAHIESLGNYANSHLIHRTFSGAAVNGATLTVGASAESIPTALFCTDSKDTTPKITSLIFEDGSNCRSIGQYAFMNCASLTEINLPESLTGIGAYAFSSTSLESVIVPRSVTVIDECAFAGIEELKSATLLGGKSIGKGAFDSCPALKTLHLPKNLSTVYEFAFLSSKIETISYEGTIADWCKLSFREPILSYAKSFSTIEGEVVDLVIPEGVTSIGNRAFQGYRGIRSLTVQSSTLARIGEDAFYGCTNLASVDLGNGVKVIGKRAFGYCESLTALYLPANLESIESFAFSSLKLQRIDYAGTTAQWRAITKGTGWISYTTSPMQAIVYCTDGEYGA